MKPRILFLLEWSLALAGLAVITGVAHAQAPAAPPLESPPGARQSLPGTGSLRLPENILERQYLQIYEYFLKEIAATPAIRDKVWQPDYSSLAGYRHSVLEHRLSLRRMLGLSEPGLGTPKTELLQNDGNLRVEAAVIPLDRNFRVRAYLFLPREKRPRPAIIAIPPATGTREGFVGIRAGMRPAKWLTSLLRRGVAVCVPLMVEHSKDHPLCLRLRGDPPHFAPKDRRQILYRLGFLVGRTLVGLEVEQVLALHKFLASRKDIDAGRIAVLGEGQGGMTALYAAAVEEELAGATVVDYFQQRETCWTEPVDRTLYGQLKEFGDAEVAALVAPRPLVVQRTFASVVPAASMLVEAVRAHRFYAGLARPGALINIPEDAEGGLEAAALATASMLGAMDRHVSKGPTIALRVPAQRIDRLRNEQFEMLHRYLGHLCGKSDQVREERWRLRSILPEERSSRVRSLHQDLTDLMGVGPAHDLPLNPRTALIKATDKLEAYEVLLDVLPGVEAYGQLLVPREVKGGAAAVICQHGVGGRPASVTGIGGDPKPQVYHAFAAKLAERGYVVFAPYLTVPEGADDRTTPSLLEVLARQAAALGQLRTGIELQKLHRIVDFLQSLPFVDPERTGYYGLSYGGYSAMWMGPLEPRLKAIVVSGYFNDWRAKLTDERNRKSYMFHPDDDTYNWNLLNRFTHLELIAALWPRAVCIEFGERDITTTPEWHARAWAQVEEFARAWNAGDRIVRDRFDGTHEIHGVLSFEFLDRWLRSERPPGYGSVR